jgi:hypothetical protein
MNRELLERANNLSNQNQNLLADEIYDYLITLHPNNDEIIFNKAINIKDSDPENSIILFAKVIEINPNINTAYNNIAFLATKNELIDLALSIFNKTIISNPNNLELVYHRATLIANQGNYISALLDFYKVVDNSNLIENPELYNQHQISEDIKIAKLHLRIETQEKIARLPIPNQFEIIFADIIEYEYPLPDSESNNQNIVLDFGDFKGLSIKEVLDNNADYIIWCILNIINFCVSEDIIEILRVKGHNISDASNINLFKLQTSREFIPTINLDGDPPDSFTIDEEGNIIY